MASTNPKTPEQSNELTAAEAARMVKRTITETDKDGKKTPKEVAIRAAEVLSWRDAGTHVVVVTKDGQKFTAQR